MVIWRVLDVCNLNLNRAGGAGLTALHQAPWSAASSGKRPRAFRIIDYYIGLSAGRRSQIQIDLDFNSVQITSIAQAWMVTLLSRTAIRRWTSHLQWHSCRVRTHVLVSLLLQFGLLGITGFENWNYFVPFAALGSDAAVNAAINWDASVASSY